MVNKMKRLFLGFITLMFLGSGIAYAGPYTDSAHGNSTYGVNRESMSIEQGHGYAKGNCAHCHEQHASIGGTEPAPGNVPPVPSNYLLFNPNHTSQTVNFCFDCHRGPTGGYQTGGLINRSYSYRAGGWNDGLNGILEAFTYGPPTSTTSSSHRLYDIRKFIKGYVGYTENSNPCVACHDPHRAQRDPHTPSNRGWPVSRPGGHGDTSTWKLWGDDWGERMSSVVPSGCTYQAPYRYKSTTKYEPDGSSITDGSNLTDYTTFCLDCHQYSVPSTNGVVDYDWKGNSTTRYNLYAIDWWGTYGNWHGAREKGDPDEVKPPYTPTVPDTNYYLNCTDCHEPHGSPNLFLIREEVNGSSGVALVNGSRSSWISLCSRCHTKNFAGHYTPTTTYEYPCAGCHHHELTNYRIGGL